MPDDIVRLGISWIDTVYPDLKVAVRESDSYEVQPLPPADWSAEMLRPDDLLYLFVSAYNLRPQLGPDGPKLSRIAPDTAATLVFDFPPQNVGEQAVYEGSAIPQPSVRARIARLSRLVFRLPDDTDAVGLTIDGLLNWDLLQPVLPTLGALPLQPTADELDAAPDVAAPASLETALEIPYRLVLSPNADARWIHRRTIASRGGRTELWHTRLAAAVDGGMVEASRNQPVPLRAIWTPGYRPGALPKKLAQDPNLGRTTITPNERHQIVTLTAGFATHRAFDLPPSLPSPIHAERVMLSALGGWLRSRGHWSHDTDHGELRALFDGRLLELPGLPAVQVQGKLVEILNQVPHYVQPPVEALDLSEWVHHAAQGRDHYVRLVHEGCLYPLGHPASQVIVTERRFEIVERRPVAALRQYSYIVVRQPVRDYSSQSYPHAGREMPFAQIDIKTHVTPHLVAAGEIPAKISDAAFWVVDNVTGRDVPFQMVGTDRRGHSVTFSMPLIFMSDPIDDDDVNDHIVAVRHEWSTAQDLDGQGQPRRRADCNSAPMDFAPGGPGGSNSVLPVRSLYLDSIGDAVCGKYKPILFKADVTLAAVESLTGRAAEITMSYPDEYLEDGFNNAVGLFAQIEADVSHVQLAGQLGLQFAASQAGGFATPNAALTYVTTEKGPIAGELPDALADHFEPASFFGVGKAPQLFGAFSLEDVIPSGSLMNHGPQLDSRIDDDPIRGKVAVTSYRWATPPRRVDVDGIISFIPDVAANSTLSIDAHTETVLSDRSATARVSGELTDFDIFFFKAVTLRFRRFAFASDSGSKMNVDIDFQPDDPFVFEGGLEFVHKLASLIPRGVFGDGPSIDVRPDAISLGLDIGLPPTPLGVFALKNLNLNGALQLPFVDGRPLLEFGFSGRSDPFLMTLSLLGGGGYFHLQLDPSGLRIVELSLEFGGAAEIDIGVASGGTHVFAGIYIALEKQKGQLQTVLSGFWRMGGALCVLGLVTMNVEFNVSFAYDFGAKKVSGRAVVTVTVEVAEFSKSVALPVERSFGRDGGDPTFGQMINTPGLWADYADAFA